MAERALRFSPPIYVEQFHSKPNYLHLELYPSILFTLHTKMFTIVSNSFLITITVNKNVK